MANGNSIPSPASETGSSGEFSVTVLRYLDGLTSLAENEALNRALAADSSARPVFVRLCRQHGQIREMLMPEAAAAAVERRIRARCSIPMRREIPAPWWRRPVWIAAAAGLMAAAGLLLFLPRDRATVPSVAVIRQAAGDVTIRRGTASFSARVAQTLVENDLIIAREGGRLSWTYHGEASSADLLDAGSLRIEPGTGKRIHLFSGKLDVRVAPQPAEAPMRIATPHAVASVLGTRFRMIVSPDDTRLRVTDGKVRFEQPANGFSVILASNEYAIASVDADGRPAARSGSLAAGQYIVGETLFFEDFGNDASAELYVPDPARFQGGVTSTNSIVPWPEPKPVAVYHEPTGDEPYIAGERVHQRGVFWVTEKKAGKIRRYALLNATPQSDGLHVLVHPAAFPGLQSFVLEYDMKSLLNVGDSVYSTLRFGASMHKTLFLHPGRDAMFNERSRAGRYYRSRIEVIACRDNRGAKYYDIREYFDSALILHQQVFAEEHRILFACKQGCVQLDNFTVQRLDPFE